MTVNFTADVLREVLYEDSDRGSTVLDEITSTGRWSIHHRFIFKYDDKLYETSYSEGATEYQDERPWSDEIKVPCKQVEAYEKTVTDYRPV